MLNERIAQIFYDIADILEIKNENIFKIRAYRKAAATLENTSQDIIALINKNKLNTLPGIGKDLAEKIKEITFTNNLKYFETLKKTISPGVLELLKIPGIGAKTAFLLYDKFNVDSAEKLRLTIDKLRLIDIPGVKEKTWNNIAVGIEIFNRGNERITLASADELSSYFIENLKQLKTVEIAVCAGSLRRQKETVRDIDILAISNDPKMVMDKFTELDEVKIIQSKGQTKSSVLTHENIQVDLRVLDKKSFGAALVYFTGSQDFNVKLRQLAIKNNLKLNEYGVFDNKSHLIASKTEKDVFKALGLAYIPPEMRENYGEIELAHINKLPKLLELLDIEGDLHIHSNYSDGKDSIEELAKRAKKMGYSYIAITDHSESLKVAGGLNINELIRKKREIDKLNAKLKNFRILFGAEVEINSQGKIDYNPSILKEFDIVIAAIHSGFKQSKEQLTDRIIAACNNKFVNIIAHPTGKLWKVRDAYELNFPKILKTAKETNTALEIDCFPDRMDLNGSHAKLAKDYGVKIAIDSDSHAIEHLKFMKYGVSTARRGWLEKKDCLNTLKLEQLLNTIKK